MHTMDSVKMETLSPKNDLITKQNINCLSTANVFVLESINWCKYTMLVHVHVHLVVGTNNK